MFTSGVCISKTRFMSDQNLVLCVLRLLVRGLVSYLPVNSLHIVNRNSGMASSDIYGINSYMIPWGLT